LTTDVARADDRIAELRALSRLPFDELAGALGGQGGVHRAIADRVFWGVSRGVGPFARPVQLTHDAVTARVYGAMRGATGLPARGADAAVRLSDQGSGLAPSMTRHGSLVLGVLQGLRGDTLEHEDSRLQQPMAVRVRGCPVTPDRAALVAAFPAATPRLVVFLHGLMETEFSWQLGSGEDGETYGSRLARDLACTPVDVRYNSGRHISENGRSLSELLEDVVGAWPVEVEEVALVGHSMGGLVARSACHVAAQESATWVRHVRHVVSLGSPHFGAPLEEAVHLASAALGALPETQPVAGFLRRRSSGIRDLRRGSLVDEDWRDRDPDALRAAVCREVPLLEHATHCFVAATITRSPKHPVARLIGDLLVLEPSASGRSRSRRVPFKSEHGMHLGGASHFALLNHPAVYERLLDWLSTPPERSRRLAAAASAR
jgi:pimeloyl-ACP methyl ester carboxylesterase